MFTNKLLTTTLLIAASLFSATALAQDSELPVPKIFFEPKPPVGFEPKSFMTCRPNSQMVMGWVARDTQGRRWDFALMPAIGCAAPTMMGVKSSLISQMPTVYLLHVTGPGMNPKQPEVLKLYLTDFSELGGPQLQIMVTKSWLGDIWGDIKDAFSDVAKFVKKLSKIIKTLVKDFNEIKSNVEQLVEEAKPLAALLMKNAGKVDEKVYAHLLVEEAHLMKIGSLLPHQRLAKALNAAMAKDPRLVEVFVDSARQLAKGRK